MKQVKKQMKTLLIGCLILCLTITGMVSVPQTAQAASSDFVIENGVLTKYNGSGGDVVIPDGVTCIKVSAFSDCKTLTSVEIPEGVTSIDELAFYGCTSLTNVKIPKSVTSIGEAAFSNTPWIRNKKARTYRHLAIINNLLIDGQSARGKVIIPDGVTKITQRAFCCNDKVTEIVVPNSVTICYGGCFGGCTSLKTITFKNRNTKMDYSVYGDENQDGNTIFGAFYIGLDWREQLAGLKSITTTLTIKGYSGSAAEKTAKEFTKCPWGNQQIKFVNLKTGKTTVYGIPTALTLRKGKTSNKLKVDYGYPYEEPDKITYKSTKKKIASINSKGKVTAKKKGTAKIKTTVSWSREGLKRTFVTKVTVK